MPPRTYSKVSHDYRSNLYGAANAATISSSLSLQREWGNAFQEVNSSNDQEPLKYVFNRYGIEHGPAALNEPDSVWEILPMPPIVLENVSTTDDNDPRTGRTITLKTLDVMWNVKSDYDNLANPRTGSLLFRRLIVLDKQPKSGLVGLASTVLTPIDTSPNENNINALINRDNERRFVILADDIKKPLHYAGGHFPAALATSQINWADHLDLNLRVTFDADAGLSADATANSIILMYCLSKQEGANTNRTGSVVNTMIRVGFTDN